MSFKFLLTIDRVGESKINFEGARTSLKIYVNTESLTCSCGRAHGPSQNIEGAWGDCGTATVREWSNQHTTHI